MGGSLIVAVIIVFAIMASQKVRNSPPQPQKSVQKEPTVQDTSKDQSGYKDEVRADLTGKSVEVLEIKGNFYPTEQFHIAEPDKCKQQHWHSSNGVAVALNKMPLIDPDPTGCGFGTIGDLKPKTITTNQADYDAFRKEIDEP